MRTIHFSKTSNVERLLTGITAVEERGASEASFLLVIGPAGTGKTRTLQWWATQADAIYLRGKVTWTPYRALAELVRESDAIPVSNQRDVFLQALELLGKNPRPVVIDEVEHALHDSRVLEGFRDLSDLLEFPLILVGMPGCRDRIKRFEQTSSRIAKVVHFAPIGREDVALCCAELADVEIGGDLVDELTRQAQGKLRGVLNGIATIERFCRRNGKDSAALADLHGVELVHDWQARRPQLVNSNGKRR